jgi:DNA polymerase III subunit epsilon
VYELMFAHEHMYDYDDRVTAAPGTSLDTSLHAVTFCVVDLETTGGSPFDDRICEIGAVKVRGGEVLGTFQTLVNPGRGVPPLIAMLTGISDVLLYPAPAIASVLPTFLEFLGGAVIVAHNARFDVGFLNAALERDGQERLSNHVVDTHALARRLVRDEVPDCKLATLASRFRLDHKPSHRALDDALAACDLLHLLLERAGGLGVRALDDLLALPRQAGHRLASKLRLTEHLPRAPGVYAFASATGHLLYVGKATNLRTRVRSYFADGRRAIGPLLRQTTAVEHRTCTSTLEAAVVEQRLLRQHRPPFNVAGKPTAPTYVRLDADARFPRLVAARRPRSGGPQLGPMAAGTARLVIDALETAIALRRCTTTLGSRPLPCRDGPCTPAQLGVASCPCAGTISVGRYDDLVRSAQRALDGEVGAVLALLAERMAVLAAAQRYEEAALARDRAAALAQVVTRQQRLGALHDAGTIELELAGDGRAVIDGGVLVDVRGTRAEPAGQLVVPDPPGTNDAHDLAAIDERRCIARWLDAEGGRARLVRSDAPLALPWRALPVFAPRPAYRTPEDAGGDQRAALVR